MTQGLKNRFMSRGRYGAWKYVDGAYGADNLMDANNKAVDLLVAWDNKDDDVPW